MCVCIMDNMVVRPWPHASAPFQKGEDSDVSYV